MLLLSQHAKQEREPQLFQGHGGRATPPALGGSREIGAGLLRDQENLLKQGDDLLLTRGPL